MIILSATQAARWQARGVPIPFDDFGLGRSKSARQPPPPLSEPVRSVPPLVNEASGSRRELKEPVVAVDTGKGSIARTLPLPTSIGGFRSPRLEWSSRLTISPSAAIPTRTPRSRNIRVTDSDGHVLPTPSSRSSNRTLSDLPKTIMPLQKTHTWVSLWFAITAPVVLWDAAYCFLRPYSMEGGTLHWIWAPYSLYQNIDYIYGIPALEAGNGFTNAQSFLNVIETMANIVYLYLAHVSSSPVAPLIGWGAALMTLSKTVLYWLQEYYCSYCSVGHNTWKNLIILWMVPNGLWLLFPSLIVYTLGKDVAALLRLAVRLPAKNGKAH